MLANAMMQFKNSLSCITYDGKPHTHIQINETAVTAKLKKDCVAVLNRGGQLILVYIDLKRVIELTMKQKLELTKNHHAKQRVSESDRGCLLELCPRPNGMNVYVESH